MIFISILKINKDGEVFLTGEIIEIIPAWDESIAVDETRAFDENLAFDENEDARVLINTLFGQENIWVDVDKFSFDGDLYTNELIESDVILQSGISLRISNNKQIICSEFNEVD